MADKQQNKETTTIEEHALDLCLNICPQNDGHHNLKRKAENNDVDDYRLCKGYNGNFVRKNEGGGDTSPRNSDGNNNNSNAGGSSSDTSSHSSQPQEKLPVSPREETHLNYLNCNQCSRKLPSSTGIVPEPSKRQCNEKCVLDKEPTPTPRSPSPKESKLVIGKPPKPNRQTSQRSVLPQMPCVSTTGNGPNGKSITGFLYKYSKTEVSIICVCHGTSFSPAGFVEHAGGVDVQHPLKHIRVVPFAVN